MQDIWMSQVQAAYNAKDSASMATLLDPSGQQVSFHAFRATLQALPNFREGTFTSLAKSFFQDQKPIADFLASYLVFVRGFQAQTDDPANAAANYRLLEDCFKMADRVFSMPDVGWFILTMRKFFQALVNLALHAGRVAGDVSLTKAGEAARMLGRPMAMAATDRSTASPTKRDVIFCVANATFKVYFALKNLRLCETVLNSTQIAINNLDKNFPKSDRCAFYYYRGRFALYQRRLPTAYQDLSKAFELCHVNCQSNGRAILTYLVAAALPLGIFPSEDLLIEFDLAEQYADLLPPLQLGDYRSVRAELDRLQPWHMSKGNYSLLCERLQVVCWRNVIRRTLFVVTNSSPIPPSGPPTLDLHCVVTTARLAFEDDTIDMDDVECICASLIDQGLLKAYVLHSKKLLVLQKGPLVGFPPIASVVLPNTTH